MTVLVHSEWIYCALFRPFECCCFYPTHHSQTHDSDENLIFLIKNKKSIPAQRSNKFLQMTSLTTIIHQCTARNSEDLKEKSRRSFSLGVDLGHSRAYLIRDFDHVVIQPGPGTTLGSGTFAPKPCRTRTSRPIFFGSSHPIYYNGIYFINAFLLCCKNLLFKSAIIQENDFWPNAYR